MSPLNALSVSPLGPFRDQNDRFPDSFIYSCYEILILSFNRSLKKVSFRAEPPRIGHHREWLPRAFALAYNVEK